MALTEVKTGIKRRVKITDVQYEEYKILTKKRYHFAWRSLRSDPKVEVYKLQVHDEDEIMGVIAITDFPDENRIEIKLLASSRENVGSNKIYEGIAGHLIAYASRLAITRYGEHACVSLVPKTRLKHHYINKYKMLDAGWQLFLEGKVLNNIISKYLL